MAGSPMKSLLVATGGTSLCDNHPEECGREDFEKEGSEKWLIEV